MQDTVQSQQELRDRQEIYACLMRYCSGVDRLDSEMLASAYHEDAWDDHSAFIGPVSDFVKWVIPIYREMKIFSHHSITNHSCELDGDTAHTESYFVSTSINAGDPAPSISLGRYIDRFEKRDGRWAIADRICLVEMHDGVARAPVANRTSASRDRNDPSYMRPLKVDRSQATT